MNNFDEVINRKGTYCTQWDYVEDRFHEKDLLPFTISDMDISCPQMIQKVLKKRIEHPIYGYSRWKNQDYLDAICGWYQRRFHTMIHPEWICYSPSVMYSVAKMIQMMSDEGDGVVILTPAYDAFYHVIINNRRKLICCELLEIENEYEIDFLSLEKALKTSKILLLCNPHNPVGKVFTKDELLHIITLCERYDINIISDDIHMDITFGNTFTPILSLPCKTTCVICTSPSKTFNTPSLGGSYILIPDRELWKEFETMTRYTEFVNSPSIFGVLSTIAAYQCDEWVDELNGYLLDNLKFVENYLKEYMPKLSMKIAKGCYFAWINTEQVGVSDEVLQETLVQKGRVAIMNGQVYGAKHRLRLNIGCSRTKVKEGLMRLKIVYDMVVDENERNN